MLTTALLDICAKCRLVQSDFPNFEIKHELLFFKNYSWHFDPVYNSFGKPTENRGGVFPVS